MVHRDFHWNGKHYVSEEAFFLGWFNRARPLSGGGLDEQEFQSLHGHVWMHWKNIGRLPDTVEPPDITAILRALAPDGPWSP